MYTPVQRHDFFRTRFVSATSLPKVRRLAKPRVTRVGSIITDQAMTAEPLSSTLSVLVVDDQDAAAQCRNRTDTFKSAHHPLTCSSDKRRGR